MIKKRTKQNLLRIIIFILALVFHAVLIFFVAFKFEETPQNELAAARVMKLVDVNEYTPPPPPPPPPREPPPEITSITTEAIAETMIETDEVPDEVISDYVPVQEEQIEYLPMSKISVLPVLPEDQIRRATIYPPIALRSGIEGMVFLELFVDRQGEIRQISILRESPEGRGFGEAAVKAFRGIRGIPAQSNGENVAVRYRYPVRFTIR
ncbi:MAG: energy transducer TonB [Treponema sp.]|jgi:protein TonB|nr:energy transducer TonB [Treponema sp.]